MAVTLNTALSTHRSSANKVQKQKFGTAVTALATKDAIEAERIFSGMGNHEAIKRIDAAIPKEDALGQKLLKMFRDHITANNKK